MNAARQEEFAEEVLESGVRRTTIRDRDDEETVREGYAETVIPIEEYMHVAPFEASNLSTKAEILRIENAGFRGCAMRAYVAFYRALDARLEGDDVAAEAATKDGIEWLNEAKLWASVS